MAQSIFKAATVLGALVLASLSSEALAVDWPPLTDRAKAKLTADKYPIDVEDPLEGFNRRVYVFNSKFDRYLFLPVTDFYTAATPSFVRERVSNFMSNLGEITNFGNSVLQGKPDSASTALKRFVVNTTVGIGGTFDPATKHGLLEAPEDFGQTLASHGVSEGAYLVLPVLGPSNMRDAAGIAFDAAVFNLIDPLNFNHYSARQWAHGTLKGVDTRATTQFRYHETGSPFEYEIVRFIYTAKRKLEAER